MKNKVSKPPFALYSLLMLLLAGQALTAQQKFALVIGNGNYSSFGSLPNAVNDANDMAAALQGLGFTVDKVLNGSRAQMVEGIARLKNRLSVSKDSYGFFFYAGHGLQYNGVNYLIPARADIPNANYLGDTAVSVQTMLAELNDAGNELNIIVLDACRDFPAAWSRSMNRGLTVVANQPADSIIVYATSAGSTASDGRGRNGLFTSQLLNNLKTPGLEIREVFRNTGADVSQASNRQQIPAVYDQFFGTAYLNSRPTAQPAPAVQAPLRPQPAPAAQAVSGSIATVISDALNLRATPAASGQLIKTLKKGDTMTVTGGSSGGWVPVQHDSDSGWVSAEYVSISAPVSEHAAILAPPKKPFSLKQFFSRRIPVSFPRSMRIWLPVLALMILALVITIRIKIGSARPAAITVGAPVGKDEQKKAAEYVSRGTVNSGKFDYERAIADFTEAIRLEPNNIQAYYGRGKAYMDKKHSAFSKKKDYTRAIADFSNAIILNPQYADAYIMRGVAFKERRRNSSSTAAYADKTKALEDFTKAIDLNPNSAEAYYQRGSLGYSSTAQKIQDCETALRLNPNHPHARQQLEWLRQYMY